MKVPLLVELYFGLSSSLELRLKRRLSIALISRVFQLTRQPVFFISNEMEMIDTKLK